MKKKRTTIVILCCALLSLFGMVGNLFFAREGYSMSEEDTTEFFATFVDTKVVKARNGIYITINTEEYGSALTIPLVITSEMDESFLSDLSPKDTIIVRVPNNMAEYVESKFLGEIVALHTTDKEYFSLEVYNEVTKKAAIPVIIGGSLYCVCAFVIIVGCVLHLRGIPLPRVFCFRKFGKK